MEYKRQMTAHNPREFAAWAHAQQRYGELPFTHHLDEVVQIARPLADDIVDLELLEAAGYLHDTIEDTPITRLFLDEVFGGIKAKAVALISDPVLPSRRERKQELHRRLKRLDESDVASRVALMIKLADRVANVRSCAQNATADLLSMYAREHSEFRDAVQRPGIGEALWVELDRRLTR